MRNRWKAPLKVLICLLAFSLSTFAKEKPVIVLVHGAFQDAEKTWTKVAAELRTEGYNVVAVNLPGRHGDGDDPQKLTTEDYKQAVLRAVSKFYIETTRDVVVSTSLQERMIDGAGVKRVFKIDAGHASYFTQPHTVAQAILSAAAQ